MLQKYIRKYKDFIKILAICIKITFTLFNIKNGLLPIITPQLSP